MRRGGKLRSQGISITPENLKISDRSTICMPYHKLLDCLERYGNGYLYQKCGVCAGAAAELREVAQAFYRECREHCASTVRYMMKGTDGLIYHKEWGIYAPAYLGGWGVS